MITKTRLKRVSPLQLGKMLAIFYGLLSLIIVPFFLVFSVIGMFAGSAAGGKGIGPAALGAGFGIVMMLVLPVFYAGMGFVLGALGGLIYNLVAKWIGGIEFELES